MVHHLLHRLASVPDAVQHEDRLFVTQSGELRVDKVHRSIGSVGRRIIETFAGGHNRRIILVTIKALLMDCQQYLDNVGQFQGGIDDNNTVREHTRQVRTGVENIRRILSVLTYTYRDDVYTCAQAHESIQLADVMLYPVQDHPEDPIRIPVSYRTIPLPPCHSETINNLLGSHHT